MKKMFTLILMSCLTYLVTAQIVITEIMYNNAGGDDYEFIEFYNNSNATVDMTGWEISSGVGFTFPNFQLAANDFIIVCTDATAFQTAFGITAFQWDENTATNNSGELIQLIDNDGNIIDEVDYDDGGDWPDEADGDGSSAILCDVNSDNNDGNNWSYSFNDIGFNNGAGDFFMSPNALETCTTGPIISILNSDMSIGEADGSLEILVQIIDGTASSTTVDISITGGSATLSDDFNFSSGTLDFNSGNFIDTIVINLDIIDDTEAELTEDIIITLSNPVNGTINPLNNGTTIAILDDDTQIVPTLVISGVYDAQPGGAGVKGIELKVIEDIPDLSIFGVGSANNGGGTDMEEYTFPAIAVSAGDCIFVADDSLKFNEFFAFDATFIGGSAVNINGDDAIELFQNGQVIDVFGDIDVDGNGQPWEYLDGWAYRKAGTGPDGPFFNVDNWIYSGPNVLDDQVNNNMATVPYPFCSYESVVTNFISANDYYVRGNQDETFDINLLINDVLPSGISNITVLNTVANGTASVNGISNISFTPAPGFCGNTTIDYQISDANGFAEATIFVEVICSASYPIRNIGDLDNVNSDGILDSLGRTAQIQGVVYGVDLQGNSDGILFTIIDGTGGMAVFAPNNFGYTVQEGDELIVQGRVDAFNCLSQFEPDTLWINSTDNDLIAPLEVTELGEEQESELIQINDLTYVSTTATGDSGFNLTVTDGTNEYILRIDNDTQIDPAIIEDWPISFSAIGIGGQFDQNPCDDGYQFLPRYESDILFPFNTIDKSLADEISFYPNPVSHELFIQSTINLDNVFIHNILGKAMKVDFTNGRTISVAELPAGLYTITFQSQDRIWASEFVKL